MLLENPINDDGPRPIHALTLVESDTPLGGVILPQGTLLMTRSDAVQRMNLYMFRPTSVGAGTGPSVGVPGGGACGCGASSTAFGVEE